MLSTTPALLRVALPRVPPAPPGRPALALSSLSSIPAVHNIIRQLCVVSPDYTHPRSAASHVTASVNCKNVVTGMCPANTPWLGLRSMTYRSSSAWYLGKERKGRAEGSDKEGENACV